MWKVYHTSKNHVRVMQHHLEALTEIIMQRPGDMALSDSLAGDRELFAVVSTHMTMILTRLALVSMICGVDLSKALLQQEGFNGCRVPQSHPSKRTPDENAQAAVADHGNSHPGA
jgi:hypothetical protein